MAVAVVHSGSKTDVAQRVQNYLANDPGASPEEFLLAAVAQEIERREQTLNGGKPWSRVSATVNSPQSNLQRTFARPTLAPEAIHAWLCMRLLALENKRKSRRPRWTRWFW
jgi:hypothetical protein